MPYLRFEMENTQISHYNVGTTDDTFDFQPQFTTDPTNPDVGSSRHFGGVNSAIYDGLLDTAVDGRDFLAWQKADALGDPVTFTLTVTNSEPSIATETLTIAHEGFLLV